MPSIRNIFVALFLALLFIDSSDPEKGITDLEKYRLKGSVKSVMETLYTLAEGGDSTAKDKILFQKLTLFNEDGYESGYTLYMNGQPYLVADYVFDPAGYQAEKNEYHSDGSLNVHVVYKYDEKGYRIRADYFWGEEREIGDFARNTEYYYEILNSDVYTKAIFKNEYRGFCTEEYYLRPDSTLSFKFISKYDFHGNKLETGYFHGSGRLSWMTKNKYDRYDNMIESRVYKSNRIAVITNYTYQFDAIGNWTYRKDQREVHVNILTEGLERADMVDERLIEYY